MNIQNKLASIPLQERAYIEGTIEYIGEEWIFFDEINEEAFELEDLGTELEILKEDNRWYKGILIEKTLLYVENDFHYLKNGDHIRYKKKLTYSFKELIDELSEPSYLNFVKTLNSFSYSLFDCVYCHNFLSFLYCQENKEGMNVIVFDNQDQICVVQHYFSRKTEKCNDRFEFAQSNGKRLVCSFWD